MAPRTGVISPMRMNNNKTNNRQSITRESILFPFDLNDIKQTIIKISINKFSIAESRIIGFPCTSNKNGRNIVLQNAIGEFAKMDGALHSNGGKLIIEAL